MINDKNWLKELENCKKIKKNNIIIPSFKKTFTKVNNFIENNNTYNNYDNNYNDYQYNTINHNIKKNESLGIDRKLDKKLKNGDFNIDLKIDFHDMTLEQAFNLLIDTINYAYYNGYRFILVITGKGCNTKAGKESIKSNIEHWMTNINIASKIIKYVDAKPKDGGNGAIYILIKRKNFN